MTALYFAYGSNLHVARMRARVPSSRPAGVALLLDQHWSCSKRGADGSGKANLEPCPGARSWGALYRFDAKQWPRLDACEVGYERLAVRVEQRDGTRVDATTYHSTRLAPDPTPARWYLDLIVKGAREHGLPAAWIAALLALPTHEGQAQGDRPQRG